MLPRRLRADLRPVTSAGAQAAIWHKSAACLRAQHVSERRRRSRPRRRAREQPGSPLVSRAPAARPIAPAAVAALLLAGVVAQLGIATTLLEFIVAVRLPTAPC